MILVYIHQYTHLRFLSVNQSDLSFIQRVADDLKDELEHWSDAGPAGK